MKNRPVPCCNCITKDRLPKKVYGDCTNAAGVDKTFHKTKFRLVEINSEGECVHCGFYAQWRLLSEVNMSPDSFLTRFKDKQSVTPVFENIYEPKSHRLVDSIAEDIPAKSAKWKK